MSLIEKALSKIRGGTAGKDAAPTLRRPALRSPVVRAPVVPDFLITDEMRADLGLNVAEDQAHQSAAEYRHIKRQLLAAMHANPANRLVLVASALAGEGKSHIAANLARSLATEPDFSVLLVDADVVKPQLTRALRLTERPGLMNAVVDETCNVDSLILATDIDGLSVLPAGSASDRATEYFGSERMRAILDQLMSVPNRVVLIDSLPLLLTTEARALVSLVAQVLLVVRAESTPQAAVQQAISLIGEESNVQIVLNAVVHSKLTRYFGYGYEYDYATRK